MNKTIKKVNMLGVDEALTWKQENEHLTVSLPEQKPCKYAYALKIEF